LLVRKAVLGMVAAQRFQDRTGASDPEKQRLAKEVQDFKDEAEHVSLGFWVSFYRELNVIG
jgi:hypothetical protein